MSANFQLIKREAMEIADSEYFARKIGNVDAMPKPTDISKMQNHYEKMLKQESQFTQWALDSRNNAWAAFMIAAATALTEFAYIVAPIIQNWGK